MVQIQQGNYRIKDEEDEIDDWKWVQPMTQRANANNIKYMRKPNSHYRDNIGQQKKEVVEAKVLKKQDKSIFPPKKDKPEIEY